MDDPSTSGVTEGFGLMYYNARMYDPALGRFTSADSIVPAGVQGYDRYAYTANNPVKYTDPTGHKPCDEQYGCDGGSSGGSGTADGGGRNGLDGDNWEQPNTYNTVADCMVQVTTENYYANVCGGQDSSKFEEFYYSKTHSLVANLYEYDSLTLALVDFSLNIVTGFIGSKNYRLAWKTTTVNLMQSAQSTAVTYMSPDTHTDALARLIFIASDLGDGSVRLTVVSHGYIRDSNGSFSPSGEFAVLINPVGTQDYKPVYIDNIFYNETINDALIDYPPLDCSWSSC